MSSADSPTGLHAGWTDVAHLSSLAPGTVAGRSVAGVEIALCRLEDGVVHAVGNVCTHESARLSDGWLVESVLACPFHGGQFDVRTGMGVCGPVERPLPVYEVKVDDDVVWIRLEQPARSE